MLQFVEEEEATPSNPFSIVVDPSCLKREGFLKRKNFAKRIMLTQNVIKILCGEHKIVG